MTTARMSTLMSWLVCAFTIELLLAVHIVGAESQSRPIRLRTATLDPNQDEMSSSSTGAPQTSAFDPVAALPVTPEATVSGLWGGVAGKRLYLMSYDSRTDRDSLAALLHDMNAVIGSYIPDDTWIVAADSTTATAAANQHGVHVLEYLPKHKIAPEWAPILSVIEKASNRHRRGRSKRQLLQSWAVGAETGTPLDKLLLHRARDIAAHATILVSFPNGLVQMMPIQQQQQQQQSLRSQVPQAAALDWAAPLGNLLQGSGTVCRPILTTSIGSMRVSVCLEDLVTVLGWLSQQPLVHFLSPVLRTSSNNMYAGIISETGGMPGNASVDPHQPVYTPFLRMGVDGSGQVIGIGDTGLCLDSCFFFDPSCPLTSNNATLDNVTGVSVLRPASHRKLVQYYGYRSLEDESGHGTHVSGTAAGVPILPADASSLPYDPRNAQGVAPGAKIAFFDILDNNTQNLLTPPADLVNQYFQVQYDAGAHIQSDSWGYDGSYAYSETSSQVDTFTWHNLDFLSIFAAGNSAANTSDRNGPFDSFGLLAGGTVQSPANAKNVIAVGAVMNVVPASEATSLILTFTAINRSQPGVDLGVKAVSPTVSIDFGNHTPLFELGELRVAVAEPYQACLPLTGPHDQLFGCVVIIGRGNCNFNTKVANAAAAGALAVIIINNSTASIMPGVNPTGLKTPVSAVPLDVGRDILSLINVVIPNVNKITNTTVLEPAADDLQLEVLYQPALDNASVFDNVVDFSAYGPLSDGRIKPDIVAPGSTLLSSFNTGPLLGIMDQCSTARLQGTSMSTPVVAGAAALTRQYFMSGYYPSGLARKPDGYLTPSGMLIKAVILAGATDVAGNSSLLKLPLRNISPPQRFQGFGRLDLTRALPLEGNFYDPLWNLQVVDMVPIDEGEVHSYSITSTGGEMIVTLVWYDYPGDINANLALVNDLDLAVTIPAAAYTSNETSSSNSGGSSNNSSNNSSSSSSSNNGYITYLGNGLSDGGGEPDRTNTVERVVLPEVAGSTVLNITVTAYNIPSAFLDPATPQRYALAVLGKHQGMITSRYNPAYNRPPPASPPPPHPPPPPFNALPTSASSVPEVQISS